MDKPKQNKMFYIGLAALVLALIVLIISIVLYFNNKPKNSTEKTDTTTTSKTTESEDTTTQPEAPKSNEPKAPDTPPAKKTMTVKVFFGNTVKNPDMIDCGKTYAVDRTVEQTVAVGRTSLTELLKGPTQAEKNQGYTSAIPAGVVLNYLDIGSNGIAYADFNDKLTAAGSCAGDLIRAQIEQTLKQWPTVKSVVIKVNGKSENILQP